MDFSEEKIFEVRHVIYGIMDKIKAWDKEGIKFAYALDNQFKIMNLCGHKNVDHDLHDKEIEVLQYAADALNILCAEIKPNGDGD